VASYSDKETGDTTPVIKTPAAGPRPDKGEMPKEELQTLFTGLVEASRQYIDLELTPDRAKATRYYKSEPFGNEKPGRSAFVVSEVHDGVQAVLPNMLRVVFSAGERALEFRPRPTTPQQAPARQAGAEQATDYIQYVFAEENEGYLRCEDVMKDGLIRKHGIFKWGWEDNVNITQEKVDSVTVDDLALLAQDPEVTITIVRPNKDGVTVSAELTRKSDRSGPWIRAVKPEELIAVRETSDLRESIFVGHQSRLTEGELLAMGVTAKDIKEHGGDDPNLRDDELAMERDPESGSGQDVDAGAANQRHLYVEGYARIDFDGDGHAELRKVCGLGPAFHIVHNDPVDELPFSVWCPDREPHSLMNGRSWADRLMDMQRLKSQLMRHMLDSASASLFPRKWYKEGDANLADLLSTQLGSPIRTRTGPNAVGEFVHTFMGKELLPVLELTNDIVERRTGINRGAAGMDANALQSSTRAAVAAAVTASQAQQEMLVRGFVEQAMKPMFRGLLKLYAKHKPEARLVKLRGQWVQVNPASWDADMDVQVNVALGSGLMEEKLQTLAEIAGQQKELLQSLGPNNPLVNYKQLRDTMAEALALRGKIDASRYFKEITDDQMKQMEDAAANTPPQPSPEEMIAQAQIQIEQAKAQAKMQTDQAKMQMTAQLEQHKAQLEIELKKQEAMLKLEVEKVKAEIEREKVRLEDDRERDKQAADIQLKIAEMELQYGVDLTELEITAQIERERMQSQAAGTNEKIASSERQNEQKIQASERIAQTKEKATAGKAKRVVSKGTKEPAKPRKRRVSVERGPDGKASGYTIEDQE
jgi:hypothetical protein